MVSYKDVQSLSGYTYLVNNLDEVMEDMSHKKFQRTQVNEEILKSYIGGTVINFNLVRILRKY
jgi:hypothetical protein